LNIRKHNSHSLLTVLAIYSILISTSNYHWSLPAAILLCMWASGWQDMLMCQMSQQEVATDCWQIKQGLYIIQTMPYDNMVHTSAFHSFMGIMSSKMLYLSSPLLTLNCLY